MRYLVRCKKGKIKVLQRLQKRAILKYDLVSYGKKDYVEELKKQYDKILKAYYSLT